MMDEERLLFCSRVEINLDQIRENYKIYKNCSKTQIIAVIKANAYGHGAIEIAQALSDEGCKNFAVANIREAIKLREAGIKENILIFGYTRIENAPLLIKYSLIQALISEEYIEALSQLKNSKKIKCILAVDTGMNRIGIKAESLKKLKL